MYKIFYGAEKEEPSCDTWPFRKLIYIIVSKEETNIYMLNFTFSRRFPVTLAK